MLVHARRCKLVGAVFCAGRASPASAPPRPGRAALARRDLLVVSDSHGCRQRHTYPGILHLLPPQAVHILPAALLTDRSLLPIGLADGPPPPPRCHICPAATSGRTPSTL